MTPVERWQQRPYLNHVLLFVLALLVSLLLQPFSRQTLDRAFNRALTSYVAARGLDATISVFQESSISAGIGVQGTFALGEVLDPINDLIERFSNILLLSLLSLGVQRLILSLGFWAALGLALLALLVLAIARSLSPPGANIPKGGIWLLRLGILIILFSPAVSLLNRAVAPALNGRYERAQSAISLAQEDLREYGDADERNWLERLDPRNVVRELRTATDDLFQTLIDLSILFTFETVLLPLATLWVLVQGGKLMLARSLEG